MFSVVESAQCLKVAYLLKERISASHAVRSELHCFTQGRVYSACGWLGTKVSLVTIHRFHIASVLTSLSVWLLLAFLTDYTYTDRKVCLLPGSSMAPSFDTVSSETGVSLLDWLGSGLGISLSPALVCWRRDTWLILPVVICLSQRLSHACLSTSLIKVKPRMAH